MSFDIAGSQAVKVCALFQDYEGHPFFESGFEEQTLNLYRFADVKVAPDFQWKRGRNGTLHNFPGMWSSVHAAIGARCHMS